MKLIRKHAFCYDGDMNIYPLESYDIIGDFHTHTLASQHAYSTVNELVQASIQKGFKALAITDHGPEMSDGCLQHHFKCIPELPDMIGDLRLYKGSEVNIKDFKGRIDLPEKILIKLDFIIASYHVEAIKPGTKEENTEGWLHAIENPFVDSLGHAGNPVFDFEHEPVIKKLSEYGKILEINNNSFIIRHGSDENCRDIIRLCMKYDVPVIITSDAHHLWNVGKVDISQKVLREMDFPPERILNTSFEAIDGYIRRRKDEKISYIEAK